MLGCISKSKKAEPIKSYRFLRVFPPSQASDEERHAFMRDHFWDKFDFADSLYTTKADTIEMLQAYAEFVADYVGPLNQEPIRALMQKASVSKSMFDYFAMLSERILHHPNSPYRSDELYIAVLEAQIASPHYDRYEKMAPEYDLRLVSQNRLGHQANDFRYTVANGRTRRMYEVKSDFTIIYFNNPGCTLCRDITKAMRESAIITQMVRSGRLKILAIYPDEQLDEWHKHYNDMPKEWINSYDRGCHINRENLYNITAIPALYMLDSEKRVLIKDSTNVGEIEEMLFRTLQPQN
jgi:hypothetical protein